LKTPLKAASSTSPVYLASALVSTYNSEKFIRGCLDDLLNQTLYKKGKLEIVIINSNSTQNEDEIIRNEYLSQHGHIKYIKTSRREPLYKAWNRGIKAASGKYLTNANTDDRHKSDNLEILTGYLEKHPKVDVVYSWQWISNIPNESFSAFIPLNPLKWDKTVRTRMLNFLKQKIINKVSRSGKTGFHFKWGCCYGNVLEKNNRIGPQPVWNKNIHKKAGFFNEKMKIAGDWEFWLRIERMGCRFARIPLNLGVFYLGDTNLEFDHYPALCEEFSYIYNRYLKNKPEQAIRFFHTHYDLIRLINNNDIYYQRMKQIFKIIPCSYLHGIMMSEIHLKKNKTSQAKIALLNAENNAPSQRAPALLIYRMASCFKQLKNFKKAKQYFLTSLRNLPLRYKSLFHLGEIALQEGQLERAKACFTKCIQLCPEHQKAKQYLVQM
jgi:glycosyltransferase involved in cell wall biosynthesis